MILKEIIELLDGDILAGKEHLDKQLDKSGASDLMSDILAGLSENCVLLTGLTSVQTIRTAIIAGVGAIVFVRGKTPSDEIIKIAEQNGIPLISTPFSMFVSCGRLHARGITGLDGSR
ncbi:MAG: hypothetical protein C4522_02820 [Desulfobacteraceae bacterium]|nr:MAG: hypothetical protein C4522_02820 [Desulfobacteraceae bacterium]